jgi:hypothetical protein
MRGIHFVLPFADKGRVARGTTWRYLRPGRFRRSRSRSSVEALTLLIAELVAERQELRDRDAGESSLERNRLQIARAQWELGHALIDRHLPQPAARNAA